MLREGFEVTFTIVIFESVEVSIFEGGKALYAIVVADGSDVIGCAVGYVRLDLGKECEMKTGATIINDTIKL